LSIAKTNSKVRLFMNGSALKLGLQRSVYFGLLLGGFVAPTTVFANDLTTLSLEELSNLEVTSVSKKPEKSFQAAAAIYVITQEDIRRSGVTSIAEALRLAPGVEVARINANEWAIGVRGFNSRASRSVLVLIDGRAVYDPLFRGTYWELQNYVLGDIDRIEVIRGSGGTLWGANAVNGVINIITKSAKETQGGRISTGAGSEEKAFGSARYGGKSKDGAFNYRVYGKYFDEDASFHANGNNFDAWHFGQSGFRTDWDASKEDLVTVQGDMFRGRAGQSAVSDAFSNLFGSNILGRWTKSFSEVSGFTLQTYYNRIDRRDPNFIESYDTGDIDFQYHLGLPGRQNMTWGVEYRVTADKTDGVGVRDFDPAERTTPDYSGFIQDVIALIPQKLALTLGAKIENNYYSGWELQPNARLLITPSDEQTIWAAVSRAVRTPSRLERDVTVNGALRGNGFDSEKVIDYEIGYRVKPAHWLSMDLAAFYNDYNDLLSAEPGKPIILSNGLKGYTEGLEFSSELQALTWWRFRGSYSLLDMNLRTKSGSLDTTSESATEGASPRHQVSLHSLMDLPHHLELDPVLRYVSALPAAAQNTPAYMELDLRLGWHPMSHLELSLEGQNLLHGHHPEFTTLTELQRGVYGRVTWEWGQ